MIQQKNELELLMPAGSMSKMNLALDYGADAVYLGPPLYSLRARDNDFGNDELQQAINLVHTRNKKVYMTLNIFSRNRKLKPFSEDVKEFAKMKPDAFIVSDPGLASIAKELCPEIPIHLSVQANCMNWQSILFWKKSLDIERVILSRELSIVEIQEIKQRVPDMQLEAFVHGSICIAYSGRCLLSSYMDKRDANQGVCDNSCREKYNLTAKDYYIEDEKNNPGKLYQIDEDQHGTYIMNAKDLCMVDHLDKLVQAGVVSFKVEGRTKSEFYAAMIARSYRGALDDVINNKPVDSYWSKELNKLSNRGYHTGFMLEDPQSQGQNYSASTIYNDKFKFLGVAKKKLGPITTLVDIKNKLEVNQFVEVVVPNAKSFKAKVLKITDKDGDAKTAVHSGSGLFEIEFQTTDANADHKTGTHAVPEIPEQALFITYENEL